MNIFWPIIGISVIIIFLIITANFYEELPRKIDLFNKTKINSFNQKLNFSEFFEKLTEEERKKEARERVSSALETSRYYIEMYKVFVETKTDEILDYLEVKIGEILTYLKPRLIKLLVNVAYWTLRKLIVSLKLLLRKLRLKKISLAS